MQVQLHAVLLLFWWPVGSYFPDWGWDPLPLHWTCGSLATRMPREVLIYRF